MVTLVFRCCVCTFSSFGEQGLLFVAVSRLLIVVASCVAEHRLYACGLQQLWRSAPCGIFLDRRSNPCPCIDQWTPNHSTTREARFESCLMRSLHSFFFKSLKSCVYFTHQLISIWRLNLDWTTWFASRLHTICSWESKMHVWGCWKALQYLTWAPVLKFKSKSTQVNN